MLYSDKMLPNRSLLSLALALVVGSALGSASYGRESTSAQPATGDSLYRARHPHLLFTRAEIPALSEKVRDGGPDDEAFRFIGFLVDSVYTRNPLDTANDYSLDIGDIPNLGLAAYLGSPSDSVAADLGWRLTYFVADRFDPDDNTYYAPLRAQALSFGYDMFFAHRPEAERAFIRQEIEAYIDTMMTVFNYDRWFERPYVSNINTMIGSALGIAAICLADYIGEDKVEAALERADRFIDIWMRHQLDPDGAYNEGAMYAGWSMRHLAYYFWVRKRYDGYNYADNSAIRSIENWIAYSTLPGGGGEINNNNDAAYLNFPYFRHHTYFDWAQTEWQSGLSAWLWDHLVAPVAGHESERLADKAATVLWHRGISPIRPDDILPRSYLWRHMGLYYFRTGWQVGARSDDVVFSFYSGKFQGGHAHEDQNNFTLYGYGEKFAIDHGFGWTSKDSEAHNMVFVDGKGQHHTGGSVGTDGKIDEFLLGGYADYLLGNATSAYTTYSEFNRPNYPFPDNDWSWGYDGGNPVNFALRRVIVVKDGPTTPYFIIVDDIEKDDVTRNYEWRMHTLESNSVDPSTNPIRITGESGHIELYVVSPAFEMLEVDLLPFDNEEIDPNATIVSLSQQSESANFAVILLPGDRTTPAPIIGREALPGGTAVTLSWPDEITDVFLLNSGGSELRYAPAGADLRIKTDAALAHIRTVGANVADYLTTGVSQLWVNADPLVDIPEATINVSRSGGTIHVDRDDVDFTFYAPGVDHVVCRGQSLALIHDGRSIRRDFSNGGAGPPKDGRHLRVWSYPNPFNATASLYIELGEHGPVAAVVYDLAGRVVRQIWDGVLPRGGNVLRWDGTTDAGSLASSGVYFLRVSTPANTQSTKLILLK